MNMMNSSRRGSALLIVLGMLAFMVMSSVGFAIYMRQSRVPSSHLRRESTARYLLKSALANAMKRIDGDFNSEFQRIEGVYDDPYPGIVPDGYDVGGTSNSKNGDFWVNRVFTPFGLVDPMSTVSTLTLEALAYLPPALINEARVYSRQTRTAQWKNLSYDLGRYAFTAIDVSDCFDLNKLRNSTLMRTSAANTRISLATLVDRGEDLAKAVKNTTGDGNAPLVSVADFNVALGSSQARFSPFSRYIPAGGTFYTASGTDASTISNALFITDTWFPPRDRYLDEDLELLPVENVTSSSRTVFDLASDKDQPWKMSDLENGTRKSYLSLEETDSRPLSKILGHNLGVSYAALWDYLDEDQIPISLCLPTAEAVPMVAGVTLAGDTGLKFDDGSVDVKTWQYGSGENPVQVTRRVTPIKFGGLAGQVVVQGTLVYPFKRTKSDQREQKSFTVETFVATYFAEDGMKSRARSDVFRPTKDEWGAGRSFVRDGIVFHYGKQSAVTFDDVKTTQEAVAKQIRIPISSSGLESILAYKINETATANDECPQDLLDQILDREVYTRDLPTSVAASALFNAYTVDGEKCDELKVRGAKALFTAEERQANPADTRQSVMATLTGAYKPYIAVWVRVVNQTGANAKTYDLVPAGVADDVNLLNADYQGAESQMHSMTGSGYPLLNFTWAMNDDRKLTLENPSKFSQIGPPDAGWKRLFCIDPRYNWAPEDWYGDDQNDAGGAQWLSQIGANDQSGQIFGKQGRDRDIFMFTSDQGYLQSIGELAFLPFTQALGKAGASSARVTNDFAGSSRYSGNGDFSSRSPTALANFANGKFFWRTYSGYARDGWNMGNSNPYRDLQFNGNEITVLNGAGGFRVNPLSPDQRVISAAVKDTPWDYIVASTNDECNAASDDHIFGKESSLASDKWTDNQVATIAKELSREMRTEAARALRDKPGEEVDWSAVLEDLDWEGVSIGDERRELFEDVDFSKPVHGVDRKFLYSYWRECFQNRQQLFLVFLRAEPLTVGGAGGDSLASSQLGARGVALVWRDPAPPASTAQRRSGQTQSRKPRNAITSSASWATMVKTEPPHRMRVLFYHQFD